MNYYGRNSSELSCMSSAAGNQSIVPGLSETGNYAAKKERDVLLIFISPSESARASHTVIFELYTSQNDMAPASRAIFVKDIRAMVESFCKRSDSVLYNVILITRGTILFTPHNRQLLTRCHSIGISKVACWGKGICLNCLLMLTSFN